MKLTSTNEGKAVIDSGKGFIRILCLHNAEQIKSAAVSPPTTISNNHFSEKYKSTATSFFLYLEKTMELGHGRKKKLEGFEDGHLRLVRG